MNNDAIERSTAIDRIYSKCEIWAGSIGACHKPPSIELNRIIGNILSRFTCQLIGSITGTYYSAGRIGLVVGAVTLKNIAIRLKRYPVPGLSEYGFSAGSIYIGKQFPNLPLDLGLALPVKKVQRHNTQQNADNGHDDYQLNQRKAFAGCHPVQAPHLFLPHMQELLDWWRIGYQ